MRISHSYHRQQPFAARDSIIEDLSALLSGTLPVAETEKIFYALVSCPVTISLLLEGAELLRERMVPVDLHADAIDTCGTGGSGKAKLNISTMTAFLLAACGAKVAKHGNRSASGRCGSFDVLERLHIPYQLSVEQERYIFDRLGIVFLFAPSHHPALKSIAGLRKQYGKKTFFNLLGPLCNPARVRRQIVGNGDHHSAALMAEALQKLSTAHSLVVTGHDGVDEVTLTGPTTIRNITKQGIVESIFSPQDLHIPAALEIDLQSGSVEENVDLFLRILRGNEPGPKEDLLLVNAAHALMLAEITKSLEDGYALGREVLRSGKAHDLLSRYADLANSL